MQGSDLSDLSSELIFSGDMSKVSSSGWHQERSFFLFDHQLVYCKKVARHSASHTPCFHGRLRFRIFCGATFSRIAVASTLTAVTSPTFLTAKV